MVKLVVVGFKGNMHRASGLLDELRILDDQWILALFDTVAIHRGRNGAWKMNQSYKPTARGGGERNSALGLLIDATLSNSFGPGAMVVEPVSTGVPPEETTGATSDALDATFWLDSFGIPNDFAAEVTTLIGPGDSAICAILELEDSDVAVAHFQGYGGTILQITLSSSQQEKLEKALGATRGAQSIGKHMI